MKLFSCLVTVIAALFSVFILVNPDLYITSVSLQLPRHTWFPLLIASPAVHFVIPPSVNVLLVFVFSLSDHCMLFSASVIPSRFVLVACFVSFSPTCLLLTLPLLLPPSLLPTVCHLVHFLP